MPDIDLNIQNMHATPGLSEDHSLINVVAIDSGSGSIKIGIAHVDPNTHEVSSDIVNRPLAIKLAQDLEAHTLMKEIMSSGQIQNLYDINDLPLNICGLFNPDLDQNELLMKSIEPMCSWEAHNWLESNYANKFSEAVKEVYVKDIADVVKQVKEADPNHPTEVWLVGTAALRKADDGHHLIDALAHKIQDEMNVDTNFKIISQQEEGIYAFEGAIGVAKKDPDAVISWDIGGGSMQITGLNDTHTHEVLGGTVASSTFFSTAYEHLLAQGVKQPGDSI